MIHQHSILFFCFVLIIITIVFTTTTTSGKDLSEKRPIIRPIADGKRGRVNRTFLENDDEINHFKTHLPEIVLKRTNPSTRVVAIGDLHGDIDAAKEIFRIAQITNDQGHWNTGTDTVIQMGDVMDRGPHGFLIMDFLQRLKQEAKAAGGELIQLLGNHELLNYFGDFRFVHPKLIEAAGGLAKYAALVQQGGKYGKIIASLPAAVIRNGTLFVHAGMTEVNVRQYGGLDDMNAIMRRVLNDVDRGHAIINEHGPIWTRQNIYSALAQKQCQVTEHGLAAITALELAQQQEDDEKKAPSSNPGNPFHKSRVYRMVVGHTIMTEGEPRTFCNGALFAIDVEMSAYMQGGGYLGYYEQLRQGVEGVQPITLFTLPRGTWQQHPPLWYPQANTTDFGLREDGGEYNNFGNNNNYNDDDDEGGEDEGDENNKNKSPRKVRMIAVRDRHNSNHHRHEGLFSSLFSSGGAGNHGGSRVGLFRGTFLMPVVGVIAVLVSALLYAIVKRYRLFGTGNNNNAHHHLPKHTV